MEQLNQAYMQKLSFFTMFIYKYNSSPKTTRSRIKVYSSQEQRYFCRVQGEGVAFNPLFNHLRCSVLRARGAEIQYRQPHHTCFSVCSLGALLCRPVTGYLALSVQFAVWEEINASQMTHGGPRKPPGTVACGSSKATASKKHLSLLAHADHCSDSTEKERTQAFRQEAKRRLENISANRLFTLNIGNKVQQNFLVGINGARFASMYIFDEDAYV